MRTALTITELTRMYQGRVCVAGYDPAGRCVRPILPPPGISERSLYERGRPAVYPFAMVEYDLQTRTPQPPHTEDQRYNPQFVRFIRALNDAERRRLLTRTLSPSVAGIFEQEIHTDFGCYVMAGAGARSLGTIQPRQIIRAMYASEQEGNWDYRLQFEDLSGATFKLKITDLTWHYYCDRQRGSDETRADMHIGPNGGPAQIAEKMTTMLQSRAVYLRIGLARGWSKFPDRCYLQVTGIHTFPDYLGGKTFADLVPSSHTLAEPREEYRMD